MPTNSRTSTPSNVPAAAGVSKVSPSLADALASAATVDSTEDDAPQVESTTHGDGGGDSSVAAVGTVTPPEPTHPVPSGRQFTRGEASIIDLTGDEDAVELPERLMTNVERVRLEDLLRSYDEMQPITEVKMKRVRFVLPNDHGLTDAQLQDLYSRIQAADESHSPFPAWDSVKDTTDE